jgi:prepilin-type N-terminal cleavage/methylation domain
MKKNNKGFTLAELLIVVAIIAVLVAIAIPVFTGQLEKSREATDASNIRAAYAEIAAAALTDPDTPQSATISKKQTQDDWQSASSLQDIAGVAITSIESTGDTTVAYGGASDPKITIDGSEVKSSFIS